MISPQASTPSAAPATGLLTGEVLRRCTMLALLLAAVVVALGAYVRLNGAGLSCPDWPGCYGQLTVPGSAPDPARAKIEMSHRYLAGSLGLLIAMLFVLSWRQRRPLAMPALLLITVIVQALLGRWTVTGLLQPAVVTAHLLGGFTTLALLGWQTLHLHGEVDTPPSAGGLRLLAVLVLCAAAVQVALGGWTSANHAALACDGFPTCQGLWWPAADYAAGFTLSLPPPDQGADAAALTAIHWTHRLGALAVALLCVTLALRLWRLRRGLAATLAALLAAQLSLGITVVLLQRPLAPAAAHSLCAALLVLCLVAVNFRLRPRTSP